MKSIKKRKWSQASAIDWICKVNNGKEKYGLKYVSAMHFLKIPNSFAIIIGKKVKND